MRSDNERAFSAESPVGRYWLHNCVGFRVEGLRGGGGIVEEIGLGSDGVDVLAVRRHNVLLPGTVLVPTHRVESVQPWEDTIVLASHRRHVRERRAAHAHEVARRLKPVGRTAAVEGGRAVRDGAIVVLRLLTAFGALLWTLAVLAREHSPTARRRISSIATNLKLIVRAYAHEARRAWHAQKQAIDAWQEARRERAEGPGDDGPLTRAGDDEDADARRREALRRR